MANQPAYELTSSVVEGILEIRISGEWTPETTVGITRDAFSAIEAHKDVDAVLVDVRGLHGRPDMTATYYHVRTRPRLDSHKMIANVDLPENRTYYAFHETTAINTGYRMRYFTDKGEARAWLKQSPRMPAWEPGALI
jgi:hypothetical protein